LVGGDGELSVVVEPLGDEAVELLLARCGAERAQKDVATVEIDDGLAALLVLRVLRKGLGEAWHVVPLLRAKAEVFGFGCSSSGPHHRTPVGV